MQNIPKPGAVVFVNALERVAEFYGKLLSLSVTCAAPDHVILESETFQLVIHAIPARVADSVKVPKPSAAREGTPIKPLFPVASIAHSRAAVSSLGGQVGPVGSEWEYRGIRRCDGFDPEGNVFMLLQIGTCCPDRGSRARPSRPRTFAG